MSSEEKTTSSEAGGMSEGGTYDSANAASYRVSQLNERYVTAVDDLLEQVLTLQAISRASMIIGPLRDPHVQAIAAHLNIFASTLGIILDGVDSADDDFYLGETMVNGESGNAYYVDHAHFTNTEAKNLGVPPGTYTLISITVDDNHNGVVGDASEHFTVLYWGHSGWMAAPFTSQSDVLTLTSGVRTIPTLEAIGSLEEHGTKQPSLLEVLRAITRPA